MVTTHQQSMDAANIRPGNRTPEHNRQVEEGSGDVRVRNADAAARREQKIYGKKK